MCSGVCGDHTELVCYGRLPAGEFSSTMARTHTGSNPVAVGFMLGGELRASQRPWTVPGCAPQSATTTKADTSLGPAVVLAV